MADESRSALAAGVDARPAPSGTGTRARSACRAPRDRQDCGLVWLVMSDPEMREEWGRRRARERERA